MQTCVGDRVSGLLRNSRLTKMPVTASVIGSIPVSNAALDRERGHVRFCRGLDCFPVPSRSEIAADSFLSVVTVGGLEDVRGLEKSRKKCVSAAGEPWGIRASLINS